MNGVRAPVSALVTGALRSALKSLDDVVVPGHHGTMTNDTVMAVDRVQLGVSMERNLVKVLKGLAEFEDMTLGQLLEKIVLHSFEPVPGEEGEQAWSALGKRSLAAVEDLKRVYGLDYDMHAFRRFRELEVAEPADGDPATAAS